MNIVVEFVIATSLGLIIFGALSALALGIARGFLPRAYRHGDPDVSFREPTQ